MVAGVAGFVMFREGEAVRRIEGFAPDEMDKSLTADVKIYSTPSDDKGIAQIHN